MRQYTFDLGKGRVISVSAKGYGEAIEKARALLRTLYNISYFNS